MNLANEYCLFGLPLSRRALFLAACFCPGLALAILFSTWSRRSRRAA